MTAFRLAHPIGRTYPETVRMKYSLFLALILGMLTASCGEESGRRQAGGQEPPTEDTYIPPEGNLLINPDFELAANGTIQSWRLSQHTGPVSYSAGVENKEVRLERINKEPWGVLSQTFRNKAMVPLQGKRLRFSAELKVDFTDEYGPPFEAAGISVMLTGISAGQSSRRLLLELLEPVDAGMKSQGWQRRTVDFDLPDAASAAWLELQLGFIMTHGGSLGIRRPYLIEVSD